LLPAPSLPAPLCCHCECAAATLLQGLLSLPVCCHVLSLLVLMTASVSAMLDARYAEAQPPAHLQLSCQVLHLRTQLTIMLNSRPTAAHTHTHTHAHGLYT
jgi:hypothetical protein